MSAFSTIRWILAAVALHFALGCAGARPFRAQLSSENATERILAVKAAGDARDVHSVPLLVDRLEDDDSAVRFFAIIALEKITGHRFGYDYSRPSNERAASVVRWREFAKNGDYARTEKKQASPRGTSQATDTGDGIAARP